MCKLHQHVMKTGTKILKRVQNSTGNNTEHADYCCQGIACIQFTKWATPCIPISRGINITRPTIPSKGDRCPSEDLYFVQHKKAKISFQ